MSYKKKNYSKITVGDVKHNSGPICVAGKDINLYFCEEPPSQDCKVTREPLWRSPLTQAALSWISLFITLLDCIPLINIIKAFCDFFKGNITALSHPNIQINFIIFSAIFIVWCFSLYLRTITKKQTMHPLFFNIAVSGYGKRLSFIKIHATCPKCGGKMRYYRKPTEWIQDYNSSKKQITKRAPVLECRRNPEHSYYLDPAVESIEHE
ncbi:hypothetical protein [Agathobaculum desmolans]|uniref:hypothetical protein n=1 Tax=Agathobaculum desmolans TaxID=39484 RepID=UPI0012B54499|nr:hypothetical protein [Agathobaculum desmolans]